MRKALTNTMLSAALAFGCFTGSALAQSPGGGGGQMQRPQTNNNDNMQNQNGANANGPSMDKQVDDRTFLKDAAMGGMVEVELGKLAAQKGTSDAVKQFGQKMVDDHTKVNDEIKDLATKAQVEIPTSIDAKHQKEIDKLSALSGAKFDKEYSKMMVKDHRKDVQLFEDEGKSGREAPVRDLANNALPTLKQHLEMAENLNKK